MHEHMGGNSHQLSCNKYSCAVCFLLFVVFKKDDVPKIKEVNHGLQISTNTEIFQFSSGRLIACNINETFIYYLFHLWYAVFYQHSYFVRD